MGDLHALLGSCSWHAERLLKKHGQFNSVLWLTEHADGRRKFFETVCDQAPDEASTAEALQELVRQMRIDFADTDIMAFAVAYLATVKATIEHPLPEAKTKRVPVVGIELHDSDGQHWRCAREIVGVNRRLTLAAMSDPRPAADSIYATILSAEPHSAGRSPGWLENVLNQLGRRMTDVLDLIARGIGFD